MQNQQSSQWLCLFALSHSDIFRSWSWSPHPFSSCQWLLELKLLQLRVTSMKKQLLIPKKGTLHELLVSKWFKSFCYPRLCCPVYRCFIVPNARHSELLCKFGLSCPSKQNWHSPTNLPAATMQNQQSLKATATATTQRPQVSNLVRLLANLKLLMLRQFDILSVAAPFHNFPHQAALHHP